MQKPCQLRASLASLKNATIRAKPPPIFGQSGAWIGISAGLASKSERPSNLRRKTGKCFPKPTGGRQASTQKFGVSKRSVCQMLDQPRSSWRFEAKPRTEEALVLNRVL